MNVFNKTVEKVKGFWEFLPDKPEETPESILRSLWLTASGVPTSMRNA